VTVLVGIDAQAIAEVEVSIAQFGDRYIRRLFTDEEVANCEDRPATLAQGLAGRFAAKEAVLKILSIGDVVPAWKSIEILRTETGEPDVVLSGEAAALARQLGVTSLSISLTRGGGIAAAAVVATVSPIDAEPTDD
jgi:holo-[acyl-carrier protein] synthase